MAQKPKSLANLKGYIKELETCGYCPKLCSQACPVGEAAASERYSPWGKMTLAMQLHQGFRSFNKDEALVFYHCLGCMQCTAACKKEIVVGEVLAEGRISAAAEGVAPKAAYDWLSRFKLYNNPYGVNLHERQRELVSEEFWTETPQAVYLPGASELALAPHHTTRTFQAFQALGIDYVGLFVGTDTSVGASILQMGFADLFRKHAFRIYNQLKGFKLIVSGDPEVVYALKQLYPRYGYKLTAKVQHLSEFLLPYVDKHHAEATDPRAFCVHEHPTLSRHLGVENAPRRLLSTLFEKPPIELYWQGRETWSSGCEEPVRSVLPNLSGLIAARRIQEILDRGANLVVTSSPSDYAQLKKYAPENLQVEGLIDVVYKHFVGELK